MLREDIPESLFTQKQTTYIYLTITSFDVYITLFFSSNVGFNFVLISRIFLDNFLVSYRWRER